MRTALHDLKHVTGAESRIGHAGSDLIWNFPDLAPPLATLRPAGVNRDLCTTDYFYG